MGWRTKEEARAYHKAWWEKNGAAYRLKNREKLRAACKRYHSNPKNRKKVNANYRAYTNARYKADVNFQIMRKLRPRVRKKLRLQGAEKTVKTFDLVGCTVDFLRGYLEGQFKPGMTWDNIHIDHHIPCSAFDLTDPEQQKQCFHYSNLRPLFAADNLKKGSKVPQH